MPSRLGQAAAEVASCKASSAAWACYRVAAECIVSELQAEECRVISLMASAVSWTPTVSQQSSDHLDFGNQVGRAHHPGHRECGRPQLKPHHGRPYLQPGSAAGWARPPCPALGAPAAVSPPPRARPTAATVQHMSSCRLWGTAGWTLVFVGKYAQALTFRRQQMGTETQSQFCCKAATQPRSGSTHVRRFLCIFMLAWS